MKNLLYKEFTLVLTPLIYVMLVLFGLFALIPSYPAGVSFFYIMAIYPMIFMGTNKGTQTNDLYFSLTLPCKRKQIVLARLITLIICEAILTASVCVFTPFGEMITNSINMKAPEGVHAPDVSLGSAGLMATIGFSYISFAVFNIIFFAIYYKDGKRFALPYILGVIPFSILISVFIVALPAALPPYMELFGTWDPLVQPLCLVIGLLIGSILNWLAYILGSKSFEKADF